MTRDLGSIVIALFGACCMANSGPARPVRPDMATLDGYVAELDGRPLPSASVQEVPSGCHVVGTPEEWGESDKSMSLTAKTGKVLFAIPMRGGHHYSVHTHVTTSGSESGSVTVAARETDAGGSETATFRPARSQR